MKAELIGGNVRAYCPDCEAVTSFEHTHAGRELSTVVVDKPHEYDGQRFSRVLYTHLRCASCHRGGMTKIHVNGKVADGVLEEFFPVSVDKAKFPNNVPEPIKREYREAERCAAFGVNRAASVLFRSVLEKTLKKNGYTKGVLENKIDEATADSVLTESRRRRAHDEIRVLGNDVLHDEWRVIKDDEVGDAAHYAQRILEDFYDNRDSVKKILIARGRIKKEDKGAQPEVASDA